MSSMYNYIFFVYLAGQENGGKIVTGRVSEYVYHQKKQIYDALEYGFHCF